MDLDSLINEITSIVMERLQKESGNKARLLVLCEGENKSLDSALNDIAFLEYFKDIKQLKSCDGVISPEICPSGLANIAMGTSSNAVQSAYLQAILSGLRLYQLKDGVRFHDYKDTMPSGLLTLYQDYEKTLRSYGVRFVTLQELRQELQGPDRKTEHLNNSNWDSEAKTSGRRLITEKQIKSLFDSGTRELTLDKKDIITSLAEDFIRANHMNIKRK